ncbi:class I SAM-dependent methyltransferase [Mycobacterium simiae]|uniref:Class I SAM-dependent methyltransferase n=1 Tax=Mycobacterium simiae TaxID=1784 RepID=A0A5B1BXU9_MYCSI|nr:class I SAM-dependent methyltransferase [Mycobacterium simiae]KAA1251994.1 class I SAM-dependent methyltransferase [Mycobacterium simiae]
MTFDLAKVAPGLELRVDGIWFARQHASVSYPEHGNAACLEVEDRSFWFRHRNRCIASVVRRFAPQDALLDIGGGNGYVAKGLLAAGLACALLEPGIDGALAARARGVDPVICARLEDVGMAPGSVGAAGMFDVLEHIEDEAGALRQVRSLLRPGGLLFLTVPAYTFLFSADDVVAGHFRRYTLRSLRRAVIGSGFTQLYATYIFAPLPPAVLLLRTLPTRVGLRQPADAELQTSEHVREGISARIIDRLLDKEAQRIEAGGTIPFGTSCLAVCSKD